MKRVNEALAIGAVVVAGSTASAGVAFTGTYTFPSTSGLPNPRAYNGSAIPNVTPGAIGISSNIIYDDSLVSGGRFTAYGWDLANAINLNHYFTFTLTAASGYDIDMTSITFGFGRNSTGPQKWQWRSSVDNYAAALTNYTALGPNVTSASGVLSLNSTANQTGTTLTLSGAAFSGLTSVTFRLYAYDASGSSTPYAWLYDELTFSGSVNAPAPVPAPGAVTLLAIAGLAGGRRRRA